MVTGREAKNNILRSEHTITFSMIYTTYSNVKQLLEKKPNNQVSYNTANMELDEIYITVCIFIFKCLWTSVKEKEQ